ncbi:MAG: YfdX family protein [Betaproteobacteria bacterium]|nr:YfdX family protein [Betaproteobacteria bacterium]MDE1981116.1 YfdX family protein [Betaproteobacteria bacterium]
MPPRPSLPRLALATPLLLALLQHPAAFAAGNAAASPERSHVHQEAAAALLAERAHLVREALTANEDILMALASLAHNDTHSAYNALADASGKLDMVLARDPHLKRVPISVRLTTTDLDATPAQVKDDVSRARQALSDSHVQEAKHVLHPLTSEMRITTDYVPLDSYPAQIRSAIKEIQAGQSQAAAQRLADTLGLVATEEKIIPLPPLKAEADVQEAEALAKADPARNKAQALALLDQAKQQLEMGRLLGYGTYDDIHRELAAVKTKVTGGTWDEKLFGRLKSLLHAARARMG